MRGISFHIPNEYGKYLQEIVRDVNIEKYIWRIGGGEAYLIENNTLGVGLFPENVWITGKNLRNIVTENDYYLIFTDLKAFPSTSTVKEIATYEQFLTSDCELILLVVDSTEVYVYTKDKASLKQIHENAVATGFTNITILTDENDGNKTLKAF